MKTHRTDKARLLRIAVLILCILATLFLCGCSRQRIVQSGGDEWIAGKDPAEMQPQAQEAELQKDGSEAGEEDADQNPEEEQEKKTDQEQDEDTESKQERTPKETIRPAGTAGNTATQMMSPTQARSGQYPQTNGAHRSGNGSAGKQGNGAGKGKGKGSGSSGKHSSGSSQKKKPGSGKDPAGKKGSSGGGPANHGGDPSGGGGTEEETDTITVTLDPEGGSCSVDHINVVPGSVYGSLPVPGRDHYRFTGWFTDKDGGEAVAESTVVAVETPHTLHAHWERARTITVTFNGNGGRVRSRDASMSVVQGGYYGTMPIPLREGYTFEGWFTASGGGTQIYEGDIVTASGNQNLYAHWIYEPFTYWSYQLDHTRSTMYSCQKLKIYWEYDEDHRTVNDCPLISSTNSINIAVRMDPSAEVEDRWVKDKSPHVIIKCVSDFGNASSYAASMRDRFRGYRVLILPAEAVYGSEEETLYYTLCLGQLLYPEWFTMDIGTVGRELGVSGGIYE